jgi:hypothetical protein
MKMDIMLIMKNERARMRGILGTRGEPERKDLPWVHCC